MFEIGFPELVLVCIVALLVLGPERLPAALRTLGLWVGRAQRSFRHMRDEIEREIGMDDVRRQLHNETIMEDIRRLEREARGEPARVSNPPPAASADTPAVPVADATTPAARPTDAPRSHGTAT